MSEKKEPADAALAWFMETHGRVQKFMEEVGHLLEPPAVREPEDDGQAGQPVAHTDLVTIDLADWHTMERVLEVFAEVELAAHGGKKIECGSGSCWISCLATALRTVRDETA